MGATRLRIWWPSLLSESAQNHVTLGCWRGAALLPLNARRATSGSKMVHIKITEGGPLTAAEIGKLVHAAVKLNAELGDPNRKPQSRTCRQQRASVA